MPKINELFAFIFADSGPDDEGVPSYTLPNGMTFPLLGADPARIDSLRPMAQEMSRRLGKPVVLARFTQREDVELIEP